MGRNTNLEILSVLLDPILPVFAIMAFGFVLGRSGKTTVQDARLINRFAMSVLLPILVFGLIANAPIHDFNIIPLITYAGVQALVFTFGFLLAFRIFKRDASESILLAFTGIFANNAFYVLPISILIYGEHNVLPITTIITLDATVTFAGAMIALQVIGQGEKDPKTALKTIVKTPALQAISLGIVCSAASITIPKPLQTFIDFNGAAGAPVALFALGVVMSQTKFRLDSTVVSFTAIKLVLFPIVIWGGLQIFAPFSPGRDLFLLGAAGPAGAMAFSLALLYDVKTDAIAQIILWTSILTLLTLAVLA